MRIVLLIISTFAGFLPCACVVAQPVQEDLVLWLDASTLSPSNSANAEGRIEQWNDLSGKNNHLNQNTPAARPHLVSNQLGDLPVVQFSGGSSLNSTEFTGFTIRDQPFHAVIVMRAEQGRPNLRPRLLEWQPTDGDLSKPASVKQHGFWIGSSPGGTMQLSTHYGDTGQAIAPAWTNTAHVVEIIYEGAQQWVHYLDGVRNGAGILNDRDFHGFTKPLRFSMGQLFGSRDPETYFEGDIAELLIYRRVLTAEEQNQLKGYLRDKWTLQITIERVPHFETDIVPILRTHCLECHGETDQEANLDLRTVSSMLRGGQRGPVLSVGHSERSEFYAQISNQEMPPTAPLPQETIDMIRRWIDAGAPCDESVQLPNPKDLVSTQDRDFWAYQPIRQTRPIRLDDPQPTRTGVDTFLLKKLGENDLTYAPDADRETLVRRIYIDLIGLPPSQAQVARFLADERPNAWLRLIDTVMASPHFGERWARSWLDWSGYVDVYGKDNDFAIIKPLPGRWRYRDYVIQSFNDDKPIDQFIVEQMAGDELVDWRSADQFTPQIRELLTATGFLLCADDDTDQPELNTPPIRHHVLQRTGEIVANNLFALTVQCAKCHDHKYEPIPQLDYYRWLANFSPVFNPQRWVTSKEHGIPNVSAQEQVKIDRHNAAITAKIEQLTAKRKTIHSKYRKELFEKQIIQLPLDRQEEAKTAFLTSPEKRSEQQSSLLAEHHLVFSDEQIRETLSLEDRKTKQQLEQAISSLNEQQRHYGTLQVAIEQNPPSSTFVLRRGEVGAPGTAVQPGNFTILSHVTDHKEHPSLHPNVNSSGRRSAMAQHVTNPDSVAGTLVARVFVNRIWQELLGVGIVPTSDNFGVSGARPTHPALLDWLTYEFIRNDWQLKPLIRTILMSTAYRQDSVRTDSQHALEIDPGNQLLWRSRLKRLTSEQIRDRILTVSGGLERTIGGEPVPLYVRPDGKIVIDMDAIPTSSSHLRRSIYILNRRNYHLSLLTTFDQPFLTTNCTVREPSTVVTQSLTMLNDEFVIQNARNFARQVLRQSPSRKAGTLIQNAFQQGLGRAPDDEEHVICVNLYTQHLDRFHTLGNDDETLMALSQICHLLFKTNEFLYLR